MDIRSPCDRNLRRLLRDGDYWLGHDIIGKLHLKQVCISIPYTHTFIWSRYMPVWKNFVPERFLLFDIDWFFHWLIDSFSNDIFLLSLALSCWDQSLCWWGVKILAKEHTYNSVRRDSIYDTAIFLSYLKKRYKLYEHCFQWQDFFSLILQFP